MTDEREPGTDPTSSGSDETTRTPMTPVESTTSGTPPRATTPVPPLAPAWDPVVTDPSAAAPAWSPATPTTPLTPASRPSGPAPVYENDVAWAISAPVVADRPASERRHSGRLRWAAALAIVVLIVGTSAAVAAIIGGRTAGSTVLGYVPEHTIMYAEARLDLPGNQRQAIGTFLQKFPGFKDQAALETKLDEVLDDLVRETTNHQQTYTGDIKPWFDGELAFSVGPLPTVASLTSGDQTTALNGLRILALVSIKDPAAAQAWLDAAIAKAGATSTSVDYASTTIHQFDQTAGLQPAYAVVDGKVVVIGDLVSVKAAIDTKGHGGFASEPGPKTALDSTSGDHVGFVYTALRPLMAWGNDATKALGGAAPAAISDSMLKVIPDWAAYWLSFDNDALVLEATAPKPETTVGPTENRASAVLDSIPSTAIVVAINNDLGKTIKQGLDLYRAEPSLKPMVDQIDQALGLVGGADAAFGWAGDSAIVIDAADGAPEGGLIVTPTDQAAAAHLFTSLGSFIALGGGQQGITVRDEDYNGTTITTIDLGDLGKLTGASGSNLQLMPLPTGHLEIAYAVTAKIVVIGSGPGFVKHVLDTTPSTSLGSNARYQQLVDRVGTGTGTAFVDIAAIRAMAEAALKSADPTAFDTYTKEIKPFVDPFDAMIASGSVSGDLVKSALIVTVK